MLESGDLEIMARPIRALACALNNACIRRRISAVRFLTRCPLASA